MSTDATSPVGTPSADNAPAPNAGPPLPRISPVKRLASGLWTGCRRLFARPRRLALAVFLLALVGAGAWLVGTQVRAWSHFRSARACLERYHSHEAAQHLRKCMEVWPDDPEVLLLAARAARRLGEFDTADRLLSRRAAPARLAEEFDLERLMLRAAQGEVDQVGEFCRVLIDRNHPATSLLLEALVHGCLETARGSLAARFLDEWLKREPDNPQAHLFSGSVQNSVRNTAQALEAFSRALELDPDLDPARLSLARILLNLNQPAQALPHLEYLRHRIPTSPEVRTQLAVCLGRLNRDAEAAALLDQVLVEFAHYPPALSERGKLAMRARDLERAETLLTRACILSDDHATLYQLYLCLGQRSKAKEAGEILTRWKQIEADLDRIGELQRGALLRSPYDPGVLHEMGQLLLRSGSSEEGLRYLHQALQQNPQHQPAHATLADYYTRVGQLGRASRHRALTGPPAKGPSPP